MLLFLTEYLHFSHVSEKNMSFTAELSLEGVYSHCGRQRWNLSSNESGKESKEEKCQFQHSLLAFVFYSVTSSTYCKVTKIYYAEVLKNISCKKIQLTNYEKF